MLRRGAAERPGCVGNRVASVRSLAAPAETSQYLHGSLGRWTHVDPSGDLATPISSNLYAYALTGSIRQTANCENSSSTERSYIPDRPGD
jgi:hypothetical protein